MHQRTSSAAGGQADVSIVRWHAAPYSNSGKMAEGTPVAIKYLRMPLAGRGRYRLPNTREEFDQARKARGRGAPPVSGRAGRRRSRLPAHLPPCLPASLPVFLPLASTHCRCIWSGVAAHRAHHSGHPAQQRLREPRGQTACNSALAGEVV